MTHLINNIYVVCLHSKKKRASGSYFSSKTGNITSYCPQILQSDHLSSGFINHSIAQNDMFYSVNRISLESRSIKNKL